MVAASSNHLLAYIHEEFETPVDYLLWDPAFAAAGGGEPWPGALLRLGFTMPEDPCAPPREAIEPLTLWFMAA